MEKFVSSVGYHFTFDPMPQPLKFWHLQEGVNMVNVKEPTLQACLTLTPVGPIATRSLNSSASQAGVGTKPCLTNIFIQRGALRATISAS